MVYDIPSTLYIIDLPFMHHFLLLLSHPPVC